VVATAGTGVDRDVEPRLAVPHARREVSGAKALRRRRQVDRFEKTRLARAVVAQQEMPSLAGSEGGVAEVAEGASG